VEAFEVHREDAMSVAEYFAVGWVVFISGAVLICLTVMVLYMRQMHRTFKALSWLRTWGGQRHWCGANGLGVWWNDHNGSTHLTFWGAVNGDLEEFKEKGYLGRMRRKKDDSRRSRKRK
jgi:hypothetical protein